MALVKASYIRENYVGATATEDAIIEKMIVRAQGRIEVMIRQPVEARAVEWRGVGNGRDTMPVPYTLKPVLSTVHARASVSDAWTALTGVSLSAQCLEYRYGFSRNMDYKVALTVGLAAQTGGNDYSADITSGGKYAALLTVLCEMTAVAFLDSPSSTAGQRRFGLKKLAETVNGAVTRSLEFVDWDARWADMLKPYRTLDMF